MIGRLPLGSYFSNSAVSLTSPPLTFNFRSQWECIQFAGGELQASVWLDASAVGAEERSPALQRWVSVTKNSRVP